MIRIRKIHSFDELDSLKEDWDKLARRIDGSSFFQSWIWNRTWCDHFLKAPGKDRLGVRVAEDDAGRILAIFPFFEQYIGGRMVCIEQFLCHRLTYHNDVLLLHPQDDNFVREVTDAFLEAIDYRTILSLRHLNERSLFTQYLSKKGSAHPQCTRLQVLSDAAIIDQSTRLGKSTRKRYRRQTNKLHREHDTTFSIHRDDEICTGFRELVELHQRRFSDAGRETVFSGRSLEFWQDIIQRVSGNPSFEVVQLRADGNPIAAGMGLHDGTHYFGIQTGFDPEFKQFSPMRILLVEIMRRAFYDLGCHVYDHGPGYEDYKYEWSPTVSTNYFGCHGGRGPYARMLGRGYRWAFLRSLPGTSQRNN